MIWYEDEVIKLENKRRESNSNPEMIFYGSSSIRLWSSLEDDFKPFKPVNLGFGGSTLAACVYFFDRIIAPYHPKYMVIYAGENDLGDGRHPEEVFIFYQQFIARVRQNFGNIPCVFISIKPSILRWNINDQIKSTNRIIESEILKQNNQYFINVYKHMIKHSGYPDKEFFEADGLHISRKGYLLWKEIILKYFADNLIFS